MINVYKSTYRGHFHYWVLSWKLVHKGKFLQNLAKHFGDTDIKKSLVSAQFSEFVTSKIKLNKKTEK